MQQRGKKKEKDTQRSKVLDKKWNPYSASKEAEETTIRMDPEGVQWL